jgi:uncharacterized protein (UPF0332 family)
MKPDKFITLAGKLAAQSKSEPAAARTATSRAYYGAFHLVRAHLLSLEAVVGKDHDLHKPLMATRIPLAVEAGRLLSMLYEDRRRADYELANLHCESQTLAQISVEQAERLKALLTQFDAEPLRGEIKAAIETYQQQSRPKTP